MRHLKLAEGAPAQIVALSRAEVDAITALRLVNISPTTDTGLWEITAGSKIGVVRAGDLQITITPKVSINRLVFMLGYALRPGGWATDEVLLDESHDLMSAVAEAFSRLAIRALEQGLLNGYRSTEDTLPVLRGRLREDEQIRRRYGRLVPLEVRYDEFTADVAENQILLAAVTRLLRVPRLSAVARRQLLRLRLQLADVTLLGRGPEVPQWTPSRLNTRYQSGLRLAEMILAGDSFEHRVGSLVVTGYLFDMWRVYEDFVSAALKEAFIVHGGRMSLQEKWHLDAAEEIRMKPDLVWYRGDKPAAVIDAKYKAEKPEGFPDADLYQLLAYCTALGLEDGHLVYARDRRRSAHTPYVRPAFESTATPWTWMRRRRSSWRK